MGKNNITGAWGEALAASYLTKKRYIVLENGFRCRFGEIDLIVRNRKMLVFVEVKLRKTDDFAQGREFVDYHKQERIRATAEFYLSQKRLDLPVRFDVVEIYAPEGVATQNPVINHLEDAFR